LPHIWAERFDVTSLAFRINRLEGQTGLAAPAGACDDRQFPQRKINIDPFEIVLARPTNLNVILRDWCSEMFCARNLRTHWKYSPPVKRFANFCSTKGGSFPPRLRSLRHTGTQRDQSPSERSLPPLDGERSDDYSAKRATSCARCSCNSSGTTPPSESKNVLCWASSFCHSS